MEFIHVLSEQVTTPYLRSEYGKDYEYDSPIKIVDQLLYGKCQRKDQQMVVLGQVLAAECTQGYEGFSNYQVKHRPVSTYLL